MNINSKKIELMYRSSKMNEEKVNVMRANVPLPDLNDQEGKESIMRYLPYLNVKSLKHENNVIL